MQNVLAKPLLNKHVVCLQKGKVNLPDVAKQVTPSLFLPMVSTIQSNLMHYGYMLDSQAFNKLMQSTSLDILQFHNDVIDYLKDTMGGSHTYTPLYGDFPTNQMSEKDAFIMANALAYYTTMGSFEGFSSVMDKPIKFENVKYTMLSVANDSEVDNIFTSLVGVNQSLMPQDMEIVKWFVESGRTLVMPEVIPFKETLCTLAAMGVDVPVRSETDILRIAVGMSGGDVSLPATPQRFKSFSRKERKQLLTLLEKVSPDPREMVHKSAEWVRLGERLHPGEFKKKFPQSFFAFTALRRGPKGTKTGKVRSGYSKINQAFATSLADGLNILLRAPGEFARRLDWIIRSCENIVEVAEVVNKFKIAAPYCSNKVIYELYQHFSRRAEPVTDRSIMIKGHRKRTKLPDLPAIDQSTVDIVLSTLKDCLKYKFSLLERLGKVWIDPELKKVPLPTNMRSIDLTLRPVMRGQRIPLDNKDAKVVRAFFHWMDKDGTRDPDLSATFVNDKKAEVLSYSHLHVGESVHSGDVIARKGPCAEYIDIDIKDAIDNGFKYVVLDVRNFRGGSLADMNGVFGMMEREHPESNNTWLPETIANCTACNSQASNTMMAIIDLETMEYIFLDIDSSGNTSAHMDVNSILDVVKYYSELPKFSVYDLLELHAEARGELVTVVPGTSPANVSDKQFNAADFMYNYIDIAKYMGI